MYILFSVIFVVNWFREYETKLHWKVYLLFTVHVVFVGRLVCSVNVLNMELVTLVHWTSRLEHQSMSQFKLVTPVRLQMDIIVSI